MYAGISVGQIAPHEHHGRARGRGQDDGPRQVLVTELWADQSREEVLEEEPAEHRHAERLDQPVHEQDDEDALGTPAHAADRREVDPQHHRVDHEPDEDGDRQVDVPDLEPAQRAHEPGGHRAERDPGDDTERHPRGEVALEGVQALRVNGLTHAMPPLRTPTRVAHATGEMRTSAIELDRGHPFLAALHVGHDLDRRAGLQSSERDGPHPELRGPDHDPTAVTIDVAERPEDQRRHDLALPHQELLMSAGKKTQSQRRDTIRNPGRRGRIPARASSSKVIACGLRA